jgi:hypothetical protein
MQGRIPPWCRPTDRRVCDTSIHPTDLKPHLASEHVSEDDTPSQHHHLATHTTHHLPLYAACWQTCSSSCVSSQSQRTQTRWTQPAPASLQPVSQSHAGAGETSKHLEVIGGLGQYHHLCVSVVQANFTSLQHWLGVLCRPHNVRKQ